MPVDDGSETQKALWKGNCPLPGTPHPHTHFCCLGLSYWLPGGDVVRAAHPEGVWVSVSAEPSGDSLWLSMALLAPGPDPWSLPGLFLFWLFLLPRLLTAGAAGQGPLPRVIYHAGKCPTAR